MRIKIFSLLTFYIIWFALNGIKYDIFYIFYFLIAISFTLYVTNKLLLFPKEFKFNPIKTISYIFWLIKEIIISSFCVSKIAWRKNLAIYASITPITSIQKDSIGIVVYANSITLTPGTVTLSTEKNKLLVHSLDVKFIEDLQEGVMDRRIEDIML